MSLNEYNKKRDFSKTKEPKASNKNTKKKQIFVVQKHDASNLHYDFRLSINGVLKSWVIPKGPSLNPKDKRLAIETEDHPLSYKDFEGIIEKGYGKGVVLVWDKGGYENVKEKDISIEQSYKKGQIEVELKGEKMKGKWALINSKLGGDKKNWLLIKMGDDYADGRKNVLKLDKSVISGKRVEDFK